MSHSNTGVSVLMSVYDRADLLEDTINSVLDQQGVDLEFIIVDDGGNDEVKACLQGFLSDSRIVLMSQSNQGLTQALINAAERSSQPFIARIDVGDVMRAGRLELQARALSEQDELALVSSWVDMRTEEGYFLYPIKHSSDDLRRGVLAHDPAQLKTPFHASVMFRRTFYKEVGGYRAGYYFSQDADLWARLLLKGTIAVIPEVLLDGLFTPSGLSGQYQDYQRQLRELVAKSNELRSQGQSDQALLDTARQLRPEGDSQNLNVNRGEFGTLYFLAKCLDDNHSKHALSYWRRTISARPWSILSWAFAVRCYLMAARYSNE